MEGTDLKLDRYANAYSGLQQQMRRSSGSISRNNYLKIAAALGLVGLQNLFMFEFTGWLQNTAALIFLMLFFILFSLEEKAKPRKKTKFNILLMFSILTLGLSLLGILGLMRIFITEDSMWASKSSRFIEMLSALHFAEIYLIFSVVFEEFIFRKILLDKLGSRNIFSWLLTTAVFVASHRPEGLGYALAMAVICLSLNYIFTLRQRWTDSLVAHLGYNLGAVASGLLVGFSEKIEVIYGALALLSVVMALTIRVLVAPKK